jgi:tetratricopeptide (TPR) repeat protein
VNIIERFNHLMARGDYAQALPLIEEMVRRAPDIASSWYNYGECLEKLKRPSDAATAFLSAVKADPADGGAYYRACLALLDANDYARLHSVFRQMCTQSPTMLAELMADGDFGPVFNRPEFQQLVSDLKT